MWRVAILVAVIGCGRTELDIDVHVSPSSIQFQVGELGSDCRCSDDLGPLGTCTVITDSISCTCRSLPGSCLLRVRVLRDGTAIAELNDRLHRGGLLVELRAGDELAFEGCGGSATVPLDLDDALPAPVIAAQTTADTIGLSWTSDPPAESTLVTVAAGLGASVCHEVGGSGQRSLSRANQTGTIGVTIQPFAGVRTYDTTLGAVRVWRGVAESLFVPPDGG